MNTLGKLFVFLGFGLIGFYIIGGIFVTNIYQTELKSYIDLSNNSSTLEQKSTYIDEFIKNLENQKFEGKYDAIFHKRESNSFEYNFQILKEYQYKLDSLSNLEMGSFEYSTALNEVQNNDTYSIPVFKGIWFLDNYVLFWGWICTVGVIFSIVLIIAGFIIVDEFDY